MSNHIEILDTVALLRDIPEAQLVQGQVGTVVEVFGESACEVEFCGEDVEPMLRLELRTCLENIRHILRR